MSGSLASGYLKKSVYYKDAQRGLIEDAEGGADYSEDEDVVHIKEVEEG